MKTRISKLVAAFALIAMAATANANEFTTSVEMAPKAGKSITLRLNDLDSDQTKVLLKDASGKVLFSDQTSGNAYAKQFNLNSLEDSRIYLEVETASELQVTPIEISKEQARQVMSEKVIMSKPVFFQQGEKIGVALQNNEKPVWVHIYDRSGSIVFKNKIKNSGDHLRKYDLSKLEDGKYTVNLSTKGRTFSHSIELD